MTDVLGRFRVVSVEFGRGVAQLVSFVALPALLFRSMANMQFSTVDWRFMVGVTAGKAVLFALAVAATVLLGRRQSNRLAVAAIHGIFSTQSNDFALGMPIVQALYSVSHPEYPSYLFVLALGTFVLLNPAGFIMCEVATHNAAVRKGGEGAPPPRGAFSLGLMVMRRVLSNPVVFMVLLGLLVNPVVGGRLPSAVDSFLQLLGSAFSSASLLSLGFAMVGKMRSLSSAGVTYPLLLVVGKTLVLSLLCRQAVALLGGSSDLADYAFIYGTFPTAPSVYVFAVQYGANPDIIASTMVLCTVLSAPIMYVSAKLISISTAPSSLDLYSGILNDAAKLTGYCSIVGAVFVLVAYVVLRRPARLPHSIVFVLALTQAAFPAVNSFCDLASNDPAATGARVRWGFTFYLVMASRVWAALLALNELLFNHVSPDALRRWQYWYHAIGWLMPAAALAATMLLGSPERDLPDSCWYAYGRVQVAVAGVMLGLVAVSACRAACPRARARATPRSRYAARRSHPHLPHGSAPPPPAAALCVSQHGAPVAGGADAA